MRDTPTTLPVVPPAPITSMGLTQDRRSRYTRAACRTRLPEKRIAATVNSATGTALASAAEATVRPRAQQASVMWCFTEPAASTTVRSRGIRSSACAVSGGQPQPVNSTSVLASAPAAGGSVKSPTTGFRSSPHAP
ncbi:hypothetical protein SUDANB105_05597 [Streptomyces sp. enrichment culture]|uniref:hypothetical protein n=1 Tax=Streptomyces sp. enrichment culture TaxID=1795815 RepID=UPI003F56AE4F